MQNCHISSRNAVSTNSNTMVASIYSKGVSWISTWHSFVAHFIASEVPYPVLCSCLEL